MKKLLRLMAVNLLALASLSQIFSGFSYGNDLKVLITAAFFLTLINFLIQPLIKILLLPFNLLTLGMFRWVSDVLCLLILTLLLPEIKIQAADFPGFSAGGFVIPPFHFGILFSFLLCSFLISLISTFILWLFKN